MEPDSQRETEDDFEELHAFLASQKQRHQKLISILVGIGIACLLLGVFGLRVEISVFASASLLGIGGLLCVRAALSAWTDIDTRDRGEFEAMAKKIEADMEKKLRKGAS